MSESTNTNPPFTADNQTTILAHLDESEFRNGFVGGWNAYLTEVEESERPITTHEVCQTIYHELDPKIRQRDLHYCAHMGWPAPSQVYSAGFLAGWTAAHTTISLASTFATT